MKKVILAALLIMVPAISQGAGYVIVDYANGGKIHEPSIGLELGGIFLSSLHPTGGAFSIGVGISAADTDEDPPSALVPAGPMTFDAIRNFNDGTEQEIYGALGAEIVPAFFAVGGIGYSSQDIKVIGTSGGQLYRIESKTENHVTGMIGMRYVLEWLNIGLGYHSRRGVMANLGVAF
jgi:hypothetical protein